MPTVRLTEALIHKLEYDGSPNTIYWDTQVKGLGIQPLRSKKSWVIQHDARPRKTFSYYGTGGKSLAEARADAMIFVGQLKQGTDPWAPNASEVIEGMTFKVLFEEWKKAPGERTGEPKRDATTRDATNCFRFSLDDWMSQPWQSITVADCRQKYEDIQRGRIDTGDGLIGTRARAVQTMAYLKAVLSYGLKKYDVDRKNPVSGLPSAWMRVKQRDEEEPPHRRLANAELTKLGKALTAKAWKHENKAVPEFVRMLFYTALRIKELSQLRYDYITATHIVVPGDVTKNHRPLKIPLTPAIKACIKRLRALPFEGEQVFLFPSDTKGGHLSDGGWPCELARRESKVNFTGHDARYTFASLGEELGFGVRLVASLLNQMSTVNSSVTHGYQPIDEAARSAAIVKINAALRRHLK